MVSCTFVSSSVIFLAVSAAFSKAFFPDGEELSETLRLLIITRTSASILFKMP